MKNQGMLSFFPGATEADLRSALAETTGILGKFNRAGMLTAADAAKISRAKALVAQQPAPEEVYRLVDGQISEVRNGR